MLCLHSDGVIPYVLPCILLYGQTFLLVSGEEPFDGTHLKNISDDNLPKGSNKLGLFQTKTLSDENIFNPVLQNYSALQEWLGGKQSPPSQVNSTVSRTKRSTSLWCDGGNQCSLSLCPWRELVDAQHSRSPVNIKYAVCLATDCNYNFPGLSQFTKNVLNAFTTCDVVRTDIRVFEHGQEKFITDWPIACLCTQHRIYAPINDNPNNGDSLNFAEANIASVHHVQNTSPQRQAISGYQYPHHGSIRQRRLRRLYRLQQTRRQNTETFEELMQRRQRENNRGRS